MDILEQAPPKEKRQKPIIVDTKKLSGIEKRVAEIGNKTVEFGYKHGLEKCYFLDENGDVVSSVTSDKALRCDITNAVKKLKSGKKYIQVHNHFENYSFSSNDVYSFVNIPQINKMVVVSEKFIFEIFKNSKTKTIKYRREIFSMVIQKFIRIYAKKYDIMLNEKNIKFIYLVANKILSKRLNYEFKITKK